MAKASRTNANPAPVTQKEEANGVTSVGAEQDAAAETVITPPKPEDDGLVECLVVSPLDHDGKRYEIGAGIRLGEKSLEKLVGVVSRR